MPNVCRAAGILVGIVVAVGILGVSPANARSGSGLPHPVSRAMESPSPSPTPIGQAPPSPIGGLAPFGLVIGILLIGGVSVLYGRRSQ